MKNFKVIVNYACNNCEGGIVPVVVTHKKGVVTQDYKKCLTCKKQWLMKELCKADLKEVGRAML